MKTASGQFGSPRQRRRSGQILIVALLAMSLLAGLVFYVYNVGQQVNRRNAMQNAADAAAISGATWQARLVPVSRYVDWLEVLRAGQSQLSATGGMVKDRDLQWGDAVPVGLERFPLGDGTQ